MLNSTHVDELLETAVSAVKTGNGFRSVLDQLPVPIYTTDATGAVTYWNQACVNLIGRQPRLGEERWCVTWQLYTMSGDPLPHDECPMARAIKERREIRNEIIIAERPDGQRVACRPYPTPYFDSNGNLEGAVNLIIDITQEQASTLCEQADRCRRLSRATHDRGAAEMLKKMASGFDDTAAALGPKS